MSEQAEDQTHDDGLIKKPMKGSVKRVSERMAEEISEKGPAEAVRDDLAGSSGTREEEEQHLEERVDEARGRPGDRA